ncbi:SlyX family protein [Aliivibrio salmonicida]|uniref:SlyX family protein n=1 Tax=Aliivibrio salmonicida TaxID=40269 RepID=UPI00406D1CBB
MTADIKKLEDKISDLEYKMAFQEQTIEELNDALSQQQLLITNMQVQMRFVVGKMKTMDTSSMADASEETPPPHY